MKFLNNWKQKIQNRRKQEVRRMANNFINLDDFSGRLYISFQGNPLIVIDEDWPASDILRKLQEIRDNYIDSKLEN
jgi:hypothetical protein